MSWAQFGYTVFDHVVKANRRGASYSAVALDVGASAAFVRDLEDQLARVNQVIESGDRKVLREKFQKNCRILPSLCR
jgi:hypothetical protein